MLHQQTNYKIDQFKNARKIDIKTRYGHYFSDSISDVQAIMRTSKGPKIAFYTHKYTMSLLTRE
jgi:hypothetical protein